MTAHNTLEAKDERLWVFFAIFWSDDYRNEEAENMQKDSIDYEALRHAHVNQIQMLLGNMCRIT